MISTRESYGKALCELGEKYEKLVVLDADLADATKTVGFREKFPNRFFDVGISEQDLMGTAAGLAIEGKIPFASTFAIFATGRAYDQVRNGICYPRLNVKIAATHAGITVGEDGATHQSLEDIALMRAIPNMMVLSPSDGVQTRWIIEQAINYKGPVYIRLTRPKTDEIYFDDSLFNFEKAVQHGDGEDATVIATGVTVSQALKAKEELKKEGINIRVLDVSCIKPIDEEAIIMCAKQTKKIITVEDHSVIGGLGSSVCEILAEKFPVKVIRMGIQDEFGQSGKWEELMEYYKITAKDIVEKVRN